MPLIELLPGWKIPHKVKVAVSGGVDSMVLLSFLLGSRRDIEVLHVNHGTPNANRYQDFVQTYCSNLNISCSILHLSHKNDPSVSLEHWWAVNRREWFSSQDAPVYLAHHLDDQIETWLMSCLQGNPSVMHWKNEHNCYRPFVLTPKANLYEWARKKNVPWIEDPTNGDENCGMRNKIRAVLVPAALQVNDGLYSVVKRKVLEDWNNK